MDIKQPLLEEIQDELGRLGEMEVGTEQYKAVVDGITKLTDRAIDLQKLEIESKEKAKDREIEERARETQIKEERKKEIARNGIAIAGIVIPTVVTIWGTLKSFKFEETGTITTMMGRGFINKLLPKK